MITIKNLRDAGLTDAQILTIVELSERNGRNSESSGAIRTARWRTKKAGVTVTSQASQSVTSKERKVSPTPPSKERNINNNIYIRARGTRLPTGWWPSDTDLAFARQTLTPEQADTEAEKFRDYWHARPGAGGVKLNWAATWRNWIRSARPRGPPRIDAVAERKEATRQKWDEVLDRLQRYPERSSGATSPTTTLLLPFARGGRS